MEDVWYTYTMSLNLQTFKVQSDNKSSEWEFFVNGQIKYTLPFFREDIPYSLYNELTGELEQDGMEHVRPEDASLFFNVLVAIRYIFEKEGFNHDIVDFYSLNDTLSLSLTFNEILDAQSLLVNDAFGNGLFLAGDSDCYHSEWEGGYSNDNDESYEEDIQYIQQYANNALSVYHYILWENFKPLFTYLKALESYEGEVIHCSKTMSEWLTIQQVIVDMGDVLPEMTLSEFLVFIETLKTTVSDLKEMDVML